MLPNNQTCAWCGEQYRRAPHLINRYKREGKIVCCSISCGKQLGQATNTYAGWLATLDYELATAIKEMNK